MDKLLDLGFKQSATVQMQNEQLRIVITDNEFSRNILYAFVVVKGEEITDWQVRYIGHSRKTFKNRMYGYQQGGGVAVNNRIHTELLSRCSNGEQVVVYCLPDIYNMNLHNLHIDIAAGLEYSLIEFYRVYNEASGHPSLQNIAGNKNFSQPNNVEVERQEIADEIEEEEQYIQEPVQMPQYAEVGGFDQILGKTYWNNPYINIPKQYSNHFGGHGETVNLYILNQNTVIRQITLIINRQAVANGTPRLYVPGEDGRWFQNWKQQNYEPNGNMRLKIIGQNEIVIDQN